MHQKNVISKTSLTNMSKSGKSAYFRHASANNFFVHFFKTFSTDLKSECNSAFFDKKKFGQISTFIKLWSQTQNKRRQKKKKKHLRI